MFAQANSEHCRHKIFNADWIVDQQPQSKTLFGMIRNTHRQINGEGILSAYSDNAAVIEGPQVDRLWVNGDTQHYAFATEPAQILMKVETHNHPTAIAPLPVRRRVQVVKFVMKVPWARVQTQGGVNRFYHVPFEPA